MFIFYLLGHMATNAATQQTATNKKCLNAANEQNFVAST